MQRKKPAKKITTIEEEIDEQETPVIEAPALDPAEETLINLRRLHGEAGLRIKVHHMRQSGWVFLAVIPPADDDEERLQRRFPDGGDFRLDYIIDGEQRFQRYVSIAPAMGANPQALQGGGSRTEMLLEKLLDRMNQPPPQQSSALELAQAIAAVRENAPPPPDPMAGVTTMFGLMKNMFDLAKNMSGNGPAEEKPWYRELFDEAKPLVAPIVAGMIKGTNGGGAPPALPAPPPPVEGTPVTENVTDEQLRAILAGLKQYRGMDPEWILEYIEGHLHDPFIVRVVGLVRSKDLEFFAQLDPEITGPAFGEWFRAIYDGLRSDLPKPNKVAADPGGKSGNKRNAPAHGEPGKAS